jgi:hypothetical protein
MRALCAPTSRTEIAQRLYLSHNGEDPHQPDRRQDRCPRPRPGRPVGLSARTGDPRSVKATRCVAAQAQNESFCIMPWCQDPFRAGTGFTVATAKEPVIAQDPCWNIRLPTRKTRGLFSEFCRSVVQ